MLPPIITHARIAFRHLPFEARQEAVQEVVCNACQAVARLAELGKLDLAYASVLARYGVAQVKDGRKVGCKLNVCDVMSPYCQRAKCVAVERLDRFDENENAWQEAVVQDTRTAPVPDIVSFRCDFSDWLAVLSRCDRRIAESLAVSIRTRDVARRFHVSAGRISQLRREPAEWWLITRLPCPCSSLCPLSCVTSKRPEVEPETAPRRRLATQRLHTAVTVARKGLARLDVA